MQDLNDKVTGNTLTAPEWNELPSEVQNVIEATGQTLSSGDLTQLRKATGLVMENIAALRAVTAGMGSVFINGRTDNNDGGSGEFYWDAASTDADDGATIIKATAITTGRWRRLFSEAVSVKWFGAAGDGVTDDTAAIQAAIDYCRGLVVGFSTGSSFNVRIPTGVYAVTKIVRRSGVSITGDGSRSTYFVALSHSEGVPYGMFEIEDGPVIASHLIGLTALGSNSTGSTTVVNASQWAMYSHAKWDAGYVHGGLWHTTHEDVEFRHFNLGLWSRAGYTTAHSQRPNQFLDYLNCRVFVEDGGEALRLTGQHGQIRFTNGDYSGFSGALALKAVSVDWDPDPSTTADNSSGSGESTSDTPGVGNAVRSGENITFSDGASIQRSDSGAFIRNARNVSFNEAWFESLGKVFDIGASGACSASGCRFANAGNGLYLTVPSAGNGWIVSPGSTASIDWGAGNVIAGTTDNIIDGTSNLTDIDRAILSSARVSTLGKTDVTTPPAYSIDSAGDIDVKGHNIIWAGPYASDKSVPLDTIDSQLMPGDTLILYAFTESITLSNSGNIRLPSILTTLTVGNRTHVTLMRIWGTGGYEWHVMHFEDEYAAALPSSGEYYVDGTRIWKSAATAGASPGWICTTTGLAGTTAVFKAMANLAA